MKEVTEYSTYDINSGDIVRSLWEHWEKYDRGFIKKLEKPIKDYLIKEDIITIPYKEGENEAFIANHRDVIYPTELKETLSEHKFPFPDYFFRKQKGDAYPSIVDIDSNYIIPKDDANFPKFFALKLSLTNETEVYDFLDYQFLKNFKVKKRYKEFLELVLKKFKEFLENGKTDVITNKYISEIDNRKPVKLKSKSILDQEESYKRQALNNTYSEFDINTGSIFFDLQTTWKKYDRELIRSIESPIRGLLQKNKIISIRHYKGVNDEQMLYYKEIKWPKDLEEAYIESNFPFPDYFLHYGEARSITENEFNKLMRNIENEEVKCPNIVNYTETCVLKNGETYFDLFFALQFSETDIMKIDEFLGYHLGANFNDDWDVYYDFLKKLCFKYHGFLKERHVPLMENFFRKNNYDTQKETAPSKESTSEFTTARQVLAMHYLLNELKVNANADRTEIARFIQFLTGKETGVKGISNTTIYKNVKSPLHKDKRTNQKNLEFIREYFEKLGLTNIVGKIDKELSKEN